MSSKTIFKCDSCKDEGVDLKLTTYAICYNPPSCNKSVWWTTTVKKELCTNCMNKLGLFATEEKRKKEPTLPSFEDIVREFVVEVVQEELDSRE